MSFFPDKPKNDLCKTYEGKTCIDSLRGFISNLPDTIEDGTIHGSSNNWKQHLLKDFDKIEKQNHLAHGRGQMGISISPDGRIEDYTWSFGQKTTRRLQKWCKDIMYNPKDGIYIAVTIHSPDLIIGEDCFANKIFMRADESVEEE